MVLILQGSHSYNCSHPRHHPQIPLGQLKLYNNLKYEHSQDTIIHHSFNIANKNVYLVGIILSNKNEFICVSFDYTLTWFPPMFSLTSLTTTLSPFDDD